MPRFERARLRGLALIAVALGSAAVCQAQIQAQDAGHWRVFSSADGLRESWIEDVTQAPGGRVWIAHGAVDSLTVYDGYTFRRVPAPAASVKIREGPTGQVWTLFPSGRDGSAGVQLLEGERWTAFPLDILEGSGIARGQFLPWAADRVLLLTPGAIVEFDRAHATVRVVRHASDTPFRRFTDLAPAADGGAWIAGPSGLIHLPNPATGGASRPRSCRAPGVPTASNASTMSGRTVFASVQLETGWAAAVFDGTAWRELTRTTDPRESIAAWPGRGDEVWTASHTRFGFRLTLQSGAAAAHARANQGVLRPPERRRAAARRRVLAGRRPSAWSGTPRRRGGGHRNWPTSTDGSAACWRRRPASSMPCTSADCCSAAAARGRCAACRRATSSTPDRP